MATLVQLSPEASAELLRQLFGTSCGLDWPTASHFSFCQSKEENESVAAAVDNVRYYCRENPVDEVLDFDSGWNADGSDIEPEDPSLLDDDTETEEVEDNFAAGEPQQQEKKSLDDRLSDAIIAISDAQATIADVEEFKDFLEFVEDFEPGNIEPQAWDEEPLEFARRCLTEYKELIRVTDEIERVLALSNHVRQDLGNVVALYPCVIEILKGFAENEPEDPEHKAEWAKQMLGAIRPLLDQKRAICSAKEKDAG